MGLASYFFTKNIDRTWRLLENLEAGMIGMNTGKIDHLHLLCNAWVAMEKPLLTRLR